VSILAANLSGDMYIRAYDNNGVLLVQIPVSGTTPQSYRISDHGPISELVIESSDGWLGPLSYLQQQVDDDFLLMMLPAIISATRK